MLGNGYFRRGRLEEIEASGLVGSALAVDPRGAGELVRECLGDEGRDALAGWRKRGMRPFESAADFRDWRGTLRND